MSRVQMEVSPEGFVSVREELNDAQMALVMSRVYSVTNGQPEPDDEADIDEAANGLFWCES